MGNWPTHPPIPTPSRPESLCSVQGVDGTTRVSARGTDPHRSMDTTTAGKIDPRGGVDCEEVLSKG